MASPFLATSEMFTYTGVDPVTGAPTGLHAISKPYSANNAYGQSRPNFCLIPRRHLDDHFVWRQINLSKHFVPNFWSIHKFKY